MTPSGLAAWIVEKWRTWSDCDGEVERRFTKDELLTTITIYWVTQTINSSTRLYYENQHNPWLLQPGQRIDVPCAGPLSARDQPTTAGVGRAFLQPQAVDSDAGVAILRRLKSQSCWPRTSVLSPLRGS